jgi:hypothetical protein
VRETHTHTHSEREREREREREGEREGERERGRERDAYIHTHPLAGNVGRKCPFHDPSLPRLSRLPLLRAVAWRSWRGLSPPVQV